METYSNQFPSFDAVEIGDELPPLHKRIDRSQLVLYSAGSGDFNPLHWDQAFPQAIALGDNIIHGRMKFAALGELVSRWVGRSGRIRDIACQYRGMDKQGEGFTCRALVTSKQIDEAGGQVIELEMWTEAADGTRTTVGTASVIFY